jgi:hypothetical protein
MSKGTMVEQHGRDQSHTVKREKFSPSFRQAGLGIGGGYIGSGFQPRMLTFHRLGTARA